MEFAGRIVVVSRNRMHEIHPTGHIRALHQIVRRQAEGRMGVRLASSACTGWHADLVDYGD